MKISSTLLNEIEVCIEKMDEINIEYNDINSRLEKLFPDICINGWRSEAGPIPNGFEEQDDGIFVRQSGNCDFGYSGSIWVPVDGVDNIYVVIDYYC